MGVDDRANTRTLLLQIRKIMGELENHVGAVSHLAHLETAQVVEGIDVPPLSCPGIGQRNREHPDILLPQHHVPRKPVPLLRPMNIAWIQPVAQGTST